MSKEVEEYIKMSIERYEKLKQEEKLKIEQVEKNKDLVNAFAKFILNLSGVGGVNEHTINESMTKAGYCLRFESRDGKRIECGRGDKFILLKE